MNNWKKIVVSPTTTLLDSMKIIDAAGTQFVMVLDDQDRLTGVLTDGDIRRAILNNIPLSAFVKVAMNPNPRSLPSHTNIVDALRLLEELHITHVPLVNKDKVVTGVVSIDERLNLSGNQNTAVLMVGGLGSRLGDLTTNCPKPMLKIAGRPVLEIILENLRKHASETLFSA